MEPSSKEASPRTDACSISNYRNIPTITYLLEKQNYFCPICKESLKNISPEVHHLDGNHSNNQIINLLLVHKACHHRICNLPRTNKQRVHLIVSPLPPSEPIGPYSDIEFLLQLDEKLKWMQNQLELWQVQLHSDFQELREVT